LQKFLVNNQLDASIPFNMLEICSELEINKYIERNRCIKLVIYQELLKGWVKTILYCAATPLHVCNDMYLPNFLTIVTLARPKYEPPDDGHRPKRVGTF
jgi:hypothetical protein